MNKSTLNRLIHLEYHSGDHLLEAGFGSGLTLQRAAALVPLRFAASVDSSQTMLEIAQQRNAANIAAGRTELKLGDMAALPYVDNCFDKIYAVQVINYLPDPLKGIQELYRVTTPGGHAALLFEPKEKFEQAGALIRGIYQPYAAEEVVVMMKQAGFNRVRSETKEFAAGRLRFKGICVL